MTTPVHPNTLKNIWKVAEPVNLLWSRLDRMWSLSTDTANLGFIAMTMEGSFWYSQLSTLDDRVGPFPTIGQAIDALYTAWLEAA